MRELTDPSSTKWAQFGHLTVFDARAELESEDEHGDHEEGDEDHGEENHDDHDGDDHVEEAGHTEFHAKYLLECGDITALSLPL